VTLAAIPSPTVAVWYLGPIPIRAYALFIVAGIIVACVVTEYRLRARGVHKFAVLDIAVWAVPFGILGGRVYHVITSPDAYFGAGGEPIKALYVWEGGLGIWGAIAAGALGVWLACRQMKLPFLVVADATAVGIPLAQAVGRLGNWFNNELYGSETSLPWGLEIYRMVDFRAEPGPDGVVAPEPVLYHPTFAYEALWNVGVALLVLYLGSRLKLGRGRAFALYVMAYTAGRFWIELLRIDDTAEQPGVETSTVTTILGQRINVWVSVLVFLAALAYFLRMFPVARGPQEFLILETVGHRTVTVPRTNQQREVPIRAYRVVTEEEYAAYEPPPEPDEAGPVDEAGERAEAGAETGEAEAETGEADEAADADAAETAADDGDDSEAPDRGEPVEASTEVRTPRTPRDDDDA
jgi:prolipoprotein diacylglyceryl transferase